MMEYIEKLNIKKEYTAPQMDVVTLDVQGALLNESTPEGLDVIVED